MAELIYHVAVSLDNYIADQGILDGDLSKTLFYFDGEHVSDFLSDIEQYAAVLMGRKTYEFGFQFGGKPGEPGYKGIKHYIFSNSMNFKSNEEVELIKGSAIEFIKNLKQNSNGKLWLCGGGDLAGSLLKQKLIDRLVLKVNPIIVGKGTPLFGNEEQSLKLDFVETKVYSNGVMKSSYKINYS